MEFQTPDWVCNIMVSMIDNDPRFILEPTPGIGNLVRAIKRKYPVCYVTQPIDIDDFENNKMIQWDWIIANPPFTPMSRGFEILNRIRDWSDNVIILLPWLLLINSEKRSKWFVDNGLCEVRHLPRRAFPGSRVQTCIIKMVRDFDGLAILKLEL